MSSGAQTIEVGSGKTRKEGYGEETFESKGTIERFSSGVAVRVRSSVSSESAARKVDKRG